MGSGSCRAGKTKKLASIPAGLSKFGIKTENRHLLFSQDIE